MYVKSTPVNLIEPEITINDDVSNVELVEYMSSTEIGVVYVNKHMGLPQNTFVSNDAVTWLIRHMKTYNTRIESVERLQVIILIFMIININ